jgi:hypothetical protein
MLAWVAGTILAVLVLLAMYAQPRTGARQYRPPILAS